MVGGAQAQAGLVESLPGSLYSLLADTHSQRCTDTYCKFVGLTTGLSAAVLHTI